MLVPYLKLVGANSQSRLNWTSYLAHQIEFRSSTGQVFTGKCQTSSEQVYECAVGWSESIRISVLYVAKIKSSTIISPWLLGFTLRLASPFGHPLRQLGSTSRFNPTEQNLGAIVSLRMLATCTSFASISEKGRWRLIRTLSTKMKTVMVFGSAGMCGHLVVWKLHEW